ncbi:hypothetical protein ME121_4267 [Methylobacterium sp. ME121]|uniref:Uncharacterized protein n=1 Tax=Methylorubrum populi TaxID=223967 RepID=A0A169QCY7_9HYPH|nr:hypothetical protein MPPM_0102 [Methylorubrum populi]GAN50228.1 hypothetical protein ME121_4267 [Methylobacterium sp. ME121]
MTENATLSDNAPTIPATAQTSHAGKKAPKRLKVGAAACITAIVREAGTFTEPPGRWCFGPRAGAGTLRAGGPERLNDTTDLPSLAAAETKFSTAA